MTGLSIVGLISTVILTAEGAVKANEIIKEKERQENRKLEFKEKLPIMTKSYMLPTILGGFTILCILGLHMLNSKKQTALLGAYSLLNNNYKIYKNKVKELYGENANSVIMKKIIDEKIEDTEITLEDDKEWFIDEYSGQIFQSTLEDVKSAIYHFARNYHIRGHAFVNEFYDFLGIETIPSGDSMGWSECYMFEMLDSSWMDIFIEKLSDDNVSKYIIRFDLEPVSSESDYF